ncbi:MAG: hypothetical protein V1647_02100 [Pseudomonadota bacterium]
MAWLSITEFSVLNKMSPSTIRRKIKANVIKFKLEEGKYYLLDEKGGAPNDEKDVLIRSLREEVSELKMLVKILEKQKNS